MDDQAKNLQCSHNVSCNVSSYVLYSVHAMSRTISIPCSCNVSCDFMQCSCSVYGRIITAQPWRQYSPPEEARAACEGERRETQEVKSDMKWHQTQVVEQEVAKGTGPALEVCVEQRWRRKWRAKDCSKGGERGRECIWAQKKGQCCNIRLDDGWGVKMWKWLTGSSEGLL